MLRREGVTLAGEEIFNEPSMELKTSPASTSSSRSYSSVVLLDGSRDSVVQISTSGGSLVLIRGRLPVVLSFADVLGGIFGLLSDTSSRRAISQEGARGSPASVLALL